MPVVCRAVGAIGPEPHGPVPLPVDIGRVTRDKIGLLEERTPRNGVRGLTVFENREYTSSNESIPSLHVSPLLSSYNA